MAHARLGPSNKRWPYCPGSVREEAKYPDTSSDAAVDGTGSHLLLEACLIHGVQAKAYLGQTIGQGDEEMPMGWFIEQDRVDRVQMCLDYIEERYYQLGMQYDTDENPVRITVETESISNPGEAYDRDDWWGTCDVTISVIDQNDDKLFVETVDYKDGRRFVDEKFNTQLIAYLHGKVYDSLTCTRGAMTIVQPKTSRPIRTHEIDIKDLQHEADKLAVAAAATDDSRAPLIPGKHCHDFCKHKKNCDTFKNQKVKEVSFMDNMSIVERVTNHISTLSPDELSAILKAEKTFTDAFKKAREEAVHRLETGHNVPGYTISTGNAKRVWNEDEATMVTKFKGMKLKQKDYYPPKLISPAQAENCPELTDIQKKNLNKYISVVDGKPTLKEVFIPEQPTPEQLLQGTEEAPHDPVAIDDAIQEANTPVQPLSFL